MGNARQQDDLNSRVRAHLRSGGFEVGGRLPAERELATSLGVGRTALRPILEELEGEGVLERRPQAGTFLRSLPALTSKGARVTLIAPFGETGEGERETDPMWLHRVVSAFERVARPAGMELQLLDQSPRAADPCSIKEMAREAANAGAGAVVLLHPLGNRCTIGCALALLHDQGVHPVIASARTYSGMASSVYFDSGWGIYCVTKHLIESGHRRIGFVGPSIGHEWVRERIAGYEQALDAAEIAEVGDSAQWIWVCDEGERIPSAQDGENAFGKWLSLLENERPTAIVGANDTVALGFLNAARKHGISIPGDLSLTGFDNDPGALLAGLSTLERPTETLGEALARVTLDRLTQESGGEVAAITHRLRPDFIERKTVAPPRVGEKTKTKTSTP
ncbi:catabolite control protein A [Abditibacteriota bacterium]|nr:catabolite control protein A [Abditibacteriota bacterium]